MKIFPILFSAILCTLATRAQYRVTTIAGTGVAGGDGDDGAATNARLYKPIGVCAGKSNDIYIADDLNARVRKVDLVTGVITTYAGSTPSTVNTGDGGPATAATLRGAMGVCVDDSGNVYVSSMSVVRKIYASTGIITTVAGNGAVNGYDGDGANATDAKLNYPVGLAVDHSGNLFIADQHNNVIRRVAKSIGIITTYAGTGVSGFSGDDGPATAAKLNFTASVALDRNGNLYMGDNYRIRKIDAATGIIKTIAGNGVSDHTGNGGDAMSAALRAPTGIGVDDSFNIYFVDNYSDVRRIDAKTNKIVSLAGTNDPGFAGDGLFGAWAQFNYPFGMCVNGAGNDIFVADAGNNRVRRLHQTTAGVENNRVSEFDVYPNPVSAELNIEHAKGTELAIYDVVGKAVITAHLHADKETVNTSTLAPGVYSAIINQENGMKTVIRLMKQ